MFDPLKRWLRRPSVIIAEVVAIILACIVGALVPQVGAVPGEELAAFRGHHPWVAKLVDAAALDHVFRSPWFLLVLSVAALSLSIVALEQMRRLKFQWNQVTREDHFRHAPFQAEFTRPQGSQPLNPNPIRTRGRLNLAGSPLFHIGLLCVILAGALQALFGVSAMVDLYEDEVLPATAEAWGIQWPGPLGKPFELSAPLQLTSIDHAEYSNGNLKSLRVRLLSGEASEKRVLDLGINEELAADRGRLYLSSDFGPAALLEWNGTGGAPLRTAALLGKKEAHAYGTYVQGPGALRARIRAPMPTGGLRPTAVEVRVLDGERILAQGTLEPGGLLEYPGGGRLKLHRMPYWARIHGDYDPALPLAYAGFLLVLLGAALGFGLTRVDELVMVRREGDVEHVRIALRPQRFAPLFRDRFERLVREHGGGV